MGESVDSKYKNHSSKFLLKNVDYQRQYSHLYAHRLAEMRELLVGRIKDAWGAEYPIKNLCDLREEQLESCIIIGTIYKHQAHKPSILREISEENQLAPQPPREHYADREDKLILEDNLQRVRLEGNVDCTAMATGVVCAALGSIEEDGRFVVDKLLFYESGVQRPLPKRGLSRLLVLMSDLDQMQAENYTDSLNIFQHWLGGNICKGEKSLIRLIVAGNSIRSTVEQRGHILQTKNTDSTDTVEAIRSLDTWFSGWALGIPIDVMPGAHDPSNFMLPQQPFHRCMFPRASKNSNFTCVTNPYECTVDDALIVGCSGQNVRDLLRSTLLQTPIDALRSTLQWSHIAPTSPDTLACYPYVSNDPFIMNECPHVYFVGNCDQFDTDLHVSSKGYRTRLVCVPSFAKTKSIAVLDLETLDCHQISFHQNDD